MLGRVTLDGTVQPGHVEIHRAERGRLARAWRLQGTGQTSPARESPRFGLHRNKRSEGKGRVLGRGLLALVEGAGWSGHPNWSAVGGGKVLVGGGEVLVGGTGSTGGGVSQGQL